MNAAKIKWCSALSNDSLTIEIFIEQTILGSFKDECLVKHAGTGWQLNQKILPQKDLIKINLQDSQDDDYLNQTRL